MDLVVVRVGVDYFDIVGHFDHKVDFQSYFGQNYLVVDH
jgi:hypothetical protein